jgi:hypothetical protein
MSPTPPFRKSIAVVIGINQYTSGIAALRTAVNDATRLGDVLRTLHGYEVIALQDSAATRARISTLLETDLPAMVGDDDRVLFYFAGHGVARDGDDGPDGFLLPVDAVRGDASTYLRMPAVHDALLSLKCRHMMVILDACFAGAFRWSGTRDVEDVVEVIHQEKYDRFVKEPAWQVITSAAQDQKALDQLMTDALGTRDGDAPHSPFALALFDALGGAADLIPRAGGDGLVTATELYLYLEETLQKAVQAAGKTQTPRLWPLKKHDKGEFVFFVPGAELTLPPAPPLTFENNPWRGLASYDAANASLFFGRDAEIVALQAQVMSRPLTVVLGASGTGKSSLVKAGVMPRLAAEQWLTLPVMRPGSAPLVALGQSLGMRGASGDSDTAAAIRRASAQLVADNPNRKILLVIDQLEELITLVRSGAERDAFLTLLAELITTHAGVLHLVVTIRTDFEPNFDRAAFGDRWRVGRYVIPPMSRESLRAVIEKPAAAKVLYFTPSALVDTLLDEVVATPGALPLLSFALSEMYIGYVTRQSGDRAITRADYDAIGGVAGALRSRAEAEREAMDAAHQATLRRVMLRLVTADGGGIARRRAADQELDFVDPAEKARAATVVQRLTAARLLVEGKEPDGDAFVEPAHDALVRGWGRLLQWVREENEAAFPLAQQQRLGRSALEWERAPEGAKSGLLWSDAARSAQLAPLLTARTALFNQREMAFATRSVRGRRIRRMITIGTTAVIAVSGVVSLIQWRRADAERRVAEAARVEADAQRSEAVAQRAAAESEKVRTVRSLFSSLRVSMTEGNPGSVCVQPACADAPITTGAPWISLAQLPASLESLQPPEHTRDFIVARDIGRGHVLVYAHDGLTKDAEMTRGGDNAVFAENALRWLGATQTGRTARAAGCRAGPPVVLVWEGTFAALSNMRRVASSIERRDWIAEPVQLERFAEQLRCAGVLWYLSDWEPPADFAARYVPMIEQFVREGGGLLVGALGWSYAENTEMHPDKPFAADLLGKPFGFSFTLDAFRAPAGEPVELLAGR